MRKEPDNLPWATPFPDNWQDGPPPAKGWWPVRSPLPLNLLRWWDGKRWSRAAWEKFPAAKAAKYARRPEAEYRQAHIQWGARPDNWPPQTKEARAALKRKEKIKALLPALNNLYRPTAWVCVGNNNGETIPSWFYVFRTPESANAFTAKAEGVHWHIYPCDYMYLTEALANFKECMK